MVRGRFAPTPSGQLHIGNARTALLAWLQIRRLGGTFVLRMEDLDRPRTKPGMAEQIIEDLRWLGLDWDEGPDGAGGPHAPYDQSERTELYEHALEQLRQNGRLYPCYCSRADLMSVASAPHGIASEGPIYPGWCRTLTAEEQRERAAIKTPSARFVLPNHDCLFHDLVHGDMHYSAQFGGDFIVKRADGIIGYQIAVVIDDAAMNITHITRGADLLDSTPRQLHLYEALGHEAPQFAHVPLLYGPDGSRLSKRHGSVAVRSIRDGGSSAEQLIGYLAWTCGLLDRPEPVSAAELVPGFCFDKLTKEPFITSAEHLHALANGVSLTS
ncbi:tRNA glutamyl-Q(34) synthetase GluQRS [Paenibacillus turpanensis]|uniref:tRNA glutamyl-Q(34) synthetase GluQRS n=1 Tax=Paenibacillus turpanensis TaxID=2689078 RepID=UPI00140C7BA3|nr:tRNA glutamyl-Q(34) synthetase GluQRS [Paenibacillus turpanensis]